MKTKRKPTFRKYKTTSERFKKTTDDCQIVAISAATGLPYDDVYKRMWINGWREGRGNVRTNWRHAMRKTLRHFGYEVNYISVEKVKGHRRPTVYDFCRLLPKRKMILRTRRHVTAAVRGTHIDLKNIFHKCPYFAWEIVRIEDVARELPTDKRNKRILVT